MVDFDDATVSIYVEKTETTSDSSCKEFLNNSKVLEVHKREDLFALEFSKENLKGLDIYRGFRNGQVMYSLGGTIKTNGATVKIAALFNPNVSNLYANELLKTQTSFQGKVFHSEVSSRKQLEDINANEIDLRNIPTRHVTVDKE